MSTCSNRSFSDETVKNFSRVSCRFGQSSNICLTVSRRETVLVDQLRQIVQHEVTTALHSQQTTLTEHLEMALRSGAATPVPVSSDPHQAQLHIGKLLQQGKINAAFQQVSLQDISNTDMSE